MINFKTIFFIVLVSFCCISCKKDDDSHEENNTNISTLIRYKDLVFSDINSSTDIIYGTSTNQGGETIDLLLDIYQPQNDTAKLRPLIVLAHGGSFTSGSKAQVASYAANFAKAGFVVAAINYRLLDTNNPATNLFKMAAIDAVFDMKAAVRFFKKDAHNGNLYMIDANNVFIGGYSAGAVTALHYAYMNTESDLNLIGGSEIIDHVYQNGGLEGNSGNPGYSSQIKGVINISGALFTVDLIQAQEPILIIIHGTADDIVPYLAGESNETGVYTEGSGLIHPVLDNLSISNLLHTIDGGNHGAFLSCSDCEADIRQFIYENL